MLQENSLALPADRKLYTGFDHFYKVNKMAFLRRIFKAAILAGAAGMLCGFTSDNPVASSAGGAFDFKSTGVLFGAGWALWSNGYVEKTVNVPAVGRYELHVQASGDVAGGVWPLMEVRVDGVVVSRHSVTSRSVQTYSTNVDLKAGARIVRIAYTNDGRDSVTGQDRNLYVIGMIAAKEERTPAAFNLQGVAVRSDRGLQYFGVGPSCSGTGCEAINAAVGVGASHMSFGTASSIPAGASAFASALQDTENYAQLKNGMLAARAKGLRLAIKPELVVQNANGQATFPQSVGYQPTDPVAFFDAYETHIRLHAKLAQETGGALLYLGTKLGGRIAGNNPASGYDNCSRWRSIIAGVRRDFPEVRLSYAATLSRADTIDSNEATRVCFWPQVDLIGLVQYPILNGLPETASTSDVAARLLDNGMTINTAATDSSAPATMTAATFTRTYRQSTWSDSRYADFVIDQINAQRQQAGSAPVKAVIAEVAVPSRVDALNAWGSLSSTSPMQAAQRTALAGYIDLIRKDPRIEGIYLHGSDISSGQNDTSGDWAYGYQYNRKPAETLLCSLYSNNTAALCSTANPPPPPPSNLSCSGLRNRVIEAGLIGLPTRGARITGATLISATQPQGGYCQVNGEIDPVSAAPVIRFQVNLPVNWNGKAMHFGGGGFNGSLVRGTASISYTNATPTPLQLAYATFGSDSGHSGAVLDASFATNDEALANFGGNHIKKVRDVASELMRLHYGTLPNKTYFTGGSTGGREGLTAAQRYPSDYDGIIAIAPAIHYSSVRLKGIEHGRAAYGLQGGHLNSAKRYNVFAWGLAACDALDGVRDRIISNVEACRSQAEQILAARRCAGGVDTGDSCLSDSQIQTVRRISGDTPLPYQLSNGINTLHGFNILQGGYLVLGGSSTLESTPTNSGSGYNFYTGDAFAKYFLRLGAQFNGFYLDPVAPGETLDRIQFVSQLMDASSVNLDAFVSRGGKLILAHGTSDAIIPTRGTEAYYQRLVQRYGQNTANSFARLYLVPGFGHGDGNFQPRWDPLSALDGWIHNGAAPGTLMATDVNANTPGRTRQLCVYPEWPRYVSGDANSASSYACAL